MLDFYIDGGVMMHPVLLSGLVGLVAAMVQIAQPRRGRVCILVGATLCTLLCGVVGTARGIVDTLTGLASCGPDMKSEMLAMGTSVSLNCLILAAILVLGQLVVGSVGVTLHLNRKRP